MKNVITTTIIVLLSFGTIAQSYMTQVKAGKAWGYANENGEMVIPPKYKKCFPFSEGFAAVAEGKSYFFIKPDGSQLKTKVKGFTLNKTSIFSEGLVPISLNNKWGYMNTEGKMVIDPKYTEATSFEKGYAIVKTETGYLIIDKSGNETKIDVSNVKRVHPFSEGLASVSTTNNSVGFIDNTGKLVINTVFLSVGNFKNGVAWAKNHTKELGYIDRKGEWIDYPKFSAGKDFDKVSGLARVKYEDQWAYVSMDGGIVFVKNTNIWGDFYDGLAKGRVGDLIGFFDNTGNYIIKPQFESVRDFKNGFAAAKQNGNWGMINLEGDWVIEPKYMGIKDMELISN